MVGGRCGFGCKTLYQLDDLEAFSRCQSQEGLQQPKAFDGLGRRGSKLSVQLRNKRGPSHLSPLTGNGGGPSRRRLAQKGMAIEAQTLRPEDRQPDPRGRPEVVWAGPDQVESMPRNNSRSKPN